MPTYTYKARDPNGKPVKGILDAGGKDELVEKLRKMGYMTTKVAEAAAGIKLDSAFERLTKVSADDMIVFNLQLANMLNAGINILASLDALSKQIENKKLKNTVASVRMSVEAGESLSDSLSRHPRIFSKLLVNMVRTGEASGKLSTVLSRYAEYFEAQEDLRRKIKEALFYPLILLFAGIAVTLFIVTFVIPQFAEIFLKTGIKLPLLTLIFYNIGIAIKHFWYLGAVFIVFCWFSLKHYIRTPNGRLRFDRLKLSLPVIGSLCRKAAISRFTRTLATLLGSGVPVLSSLDIVREVVGNEVIGRVLVNVRNCVEKGEGMSGPLKMSGEFGADAVQMISAGEETGSLDEMLNKISQFYDLSLSHAVKKLTAIIEPVFLVIMGVMVGAIMASMLLPMFDMVKILRH